MDKLLRHSLTRSCLLASYNHTQPMLLLQNNKRMFARKGVRQPKGSFGKEDTLGANSGFPKHKELFTEGYYSGEPQNEDFEKQFATKNVSTLEDRFFRRSTLDNLRDNFFDFLVVESKNNSSP